MSAKGARSGAPVDWKDPEQAAAQVKIDALYNMISRNPMSYSEKDEFVRKGLADDKAREKKSNPKKDWEI